MAHWVGSSKSLGFRHGVALVRVNCLSGIFAGTSEGVLFGSGLPLVTAARIRVGPVSRSGSREFRDPTVAPGSSPTRTPSDFPLGARSAKNSIFAPSRGEAAICLSREAARLQARERAERSSASPRPQGEQPWRKQSSSARGCGASRRCSCDTVPGGEGVLVGDDPEATVGWQQDLAPRVDTGPRRTQAAATSGSPEPKRTPPPTTNRDASRSGRAATRAARS
jgi:hypothetical protein